jgi:AAA15 family ATPase/GTPase
VLIFAIDLQNIAMIVKFSITNFGPIRERQTLSFEAEKSEHLQNYYVTEIAGHRILKAALLFGANASGKTNVLNALDCLRKLATVPAGSKTDSISCEPFLMDKESRLQPTEFEIDFIQGKDLFRYTVKLNRECILYERLRSQSRRRIVYTRTTDVESQLTKIVFGEDYPVKNAVEAATLSSNTLWNETVLAGFTKTNMSHKALLAVQNWFQNYLAPMVHPRDTLTKFILNLMDKGLIDRDRFTDILKKADFNIGGVVLPKERGEEDLRLVHIGQDGKLFDDIPYASESLGTRRYFELTGILYLLIAHPSTFPIDEIESSIHPDLVKHFLLSFCTNASTSQIIVTTHNRELLNDKDIFRSDIICFTEKDETFATKIYKLSDFGTDVVRNTSNILNAYNAGRLGALPRLSDYFIDLKEEE